MLNGSCFALTVGFIAVAVSLISASRGGRFGYLGGWVDNVTMRINDAILVFNLFLILLPCPSGSAFSTLCRNWTR
jgi:ABC-type dipeptide/oligopeptide/nickel transport system permease subunit